MRYSLWSHGILVGHTDLDIPTVTPTMRQGFIEPTDDGMAALSDATSVVRAMDEARRLKRARGGKELPSDLELFRDACERRESCDFELRDESATLFECEFMRIWDLHEMHDSSFDDDEDCETEAADDSEEDAEFDAEALADDDFIRDWIEDRESEEVFHSSWPPAEEDSRWETMRYQIQVHLKGCFDLNIDDAIDLM